MAEITYKLLRDILKELMPAEINSKSLQHLLLLTPETEKNLKDQKSRWPKEKNWLEQANKKVEEYTALNPRTLEEELAQSGICKLRNCCYKKGSKLYMNFEERLLHLVEAVFKIAPNNRSDPFQTVVEMLQKNGIPQEDVETFEALTIDEDSAEIAKFLVNHVKNTRGKRRTTQKKTEKNEYCYVGMSPEVYEVEDELTSRNGTYGYVLTTTVIPGADERTVIHREKELEELERRLTEQPGASVMLSGFGGIGKTTLARVLWKKLRSNFNQIGWINYQGNLKASILACIDLNEEEKEQTDSDMRWRKVYQRLKNGLAKTLLVIDNVDSNPAIGQDPLTDELLKEVSWWPNVTVLVTSRLEQGHLPGYANCYNVKQLGGDEHRKEYCADLFCIYYSKNETHSPMDNAEQREIIYRLIARAGYHTYAIELLAKSAGRVSSLKEYLEKIETSGFQFPQLKIYTDHSGEHAKAAEQLRKLFNLETRSARERQILLDFSVLPELSSLSGQEIAEWLGYTEEDDDLNHLVYEGWLTFDQGFSMHPLVREAVRLSYKNGKAPEGTAANLLAQLKKGMFLTEQMSYVVTVRRLEIAESILKLTPEAEAPAYANIHFLLGEYLFAKVGRRLSAIDCYKRALASYQALEKAGPDKYTRCIVSAYYKLGYVESATYGYRVEAEEHLRKAIEICSTWLEHHPQETAYKEQLGLACDHLGYVLSDYEIKWEEAKRLLLEALRIWSELKSTASEQFDTELATTCDNLGHLLSLDTNQEILAEQLLRKALELRHKLEDKEPGKHSAEVSWTCWNLGDLLAKNRSRRAEAEQLYREALKINCYLEEENPGVYVGDVAWTYARLAKLLSSESNRMEEAEVMRSSATRLYKKIDGEHLGFFADELLSEGRHLTPNIYLT